MDEQEVAAPETVVERAQRILNHVHATKAWALAKVDAMEAALAEAGGAPTPELAGLIAQVRDAAA